MSAILILLFYLIGQGVFALLMYHLLRPLLLQAAIAAQRCADEKSAGQKREERMEVVFTQVIQIMSQVVHLMAFNGESGLHRALQKKSEAETQVDKRNQSTHRMDASA